MDLSFILDLLVFILSLGVLVLIHELGHFLTAKLFGVYCREFSIGMGPLIAKFKKAGGETQFSLRAIPIGGFVSMVGEDAGDNEQAGGQLDPEKKKEEDLTEEDRKILALPKERRLDGIAKWKRLIIMAAGVIMNVVLAFLLFVGQGATSMVIDETVNYVYAEDGGVFQKSGYIEKSSIVHGSYVFVVTDASGNTETKEKSTDFENIKEISNFIYTINNEEFYPNSSTDHVTFTFDCIAPSKEGAYLEENKYNISFTLNVVENEAFSSGLFYDTKNLGIAFYGRDRSFGEVIVFAAESTGENALLIYKALGMLFTPEGLNNVGGPIAMFQMSSLAMSLGISSFFFLWGVISINLAVMNFLPIPGLDGWHFLVLIVEAITRKEMPKNAKNIASMIGLILLFGLMIVITFKDIFTLIF